jgi:hypothetical protein
MKLVIAFAAAGCLLLSGCMTAITDERAYCTPTLNPPPITAGCGLGNPPSGWYSVRDDLLYILDWDRRTDVLKALKAELLAPDIVLFAVDTRKIKVRFQRMGRSGPTETKEGFVLPHKEGKAWAPGVAPVFGDVLIWLDHQCITDNLIMNCSPWQFQAAPNGPWQNGFGKWANGQKTKSFGACVPKKQDNCVSTWTDTGDIDVYQDNACTQKVLTMPYGTWICLAP